MYNVLWKIAYQSDNSKRIINEMCNKYLPHIKEWFFNKPLDKLTTKKLQQKCKELNVKKTQIEKFIFFMLIDIFSAKIWDQDKFNTDKWYCYVIQKWYKLFNQELSSGNGWEI